MQGAKLGSNSHMQACIAHVVHQPLMIMSKILNFLSLLTSDKLHPFWQSKFTRDYRPLCRSVAILPAMLSIRLQATKKHWREAEIMSSLENAGRGPSAYAILTSCTWPQQDAHQIALQTGPACREWGSQLLSYRTCLLYTCRYTHTYLIPWLGSRDVPLLGQTRFQLVVPEHPPRLLVSLEHCSTFLAVFGFSACLELFRIHVRRTLIL